MFTRFSLLTLSDVNCQRKQNCYIKKIWKGILTFYRPSTLKMSVLIFLLYFLRQKFEQMKPRVFSIEKNLQWENNKIFIVSVQFLNFICFLREKKTFTLVKVGFKPLTSYPKHFLTKTTRCRRIIKHLSLKFAFLPTCIFIQNQFTDRAVLPIIFAFFSRSVASNKIPCIYFETFVILL